MDNSLDLVPEEDVRAAILQENIDILAAEGSDLNFLLLLFLSKKYIF